MELNTIMWIILAVVLFLVEAFTVNLVTVWFAIGGIVTAICTLFVKNTTYQILIFLGVSLILLILTRPLVKKFFNPKNTNAPSNVDSEGIVIEEINNLSACGQVKLNGNVWSARSFDNSVIEAESVVIIKEVKGVTLYVIKK